MSKLVGSLLACMALALFPFQQLASEQTEGQIVAEGEYVLRGDSRSWSGRSESYEIRERWTLFRTGKDRYEVRGQVSIPSVNDNLREFHYLLALDGDLHPTLFELTMQAEKAGVIRLEFFPGELTYEVTRQEHREAGEVILNVDSEYDLYPAISQWFVASIARRAVGVSAEMNKVALVFMDDSSKSAFDFEVYEGKLQRVGFTMLSLGGRDVMAQEFQLQSDPLPRLRIWLGEGGVLLATEQVGEGSRYRVELVRYEKYAEFGPGVE